MLRADAKALQYELEKSLHERNALMKQLDGTSEEIRYLRKQAGIADDAPLDLAGFRSQVQAETAQLRALNAQLEREVNELEEERRRLRNELRFRAKWQGAHAARLGLSARQLQALEEYADALRAGRRAAQKAVGPEGDELANVGVVADLEVQVKHLQQRLAAALAHGGVSPDDTPPEVVVRPRPPPIAHCGFSPSAATRLLSRPCASNLPSRCTHLSGRAPPPAGRRPSGARGNGGGDRARAPRRRSAEPRG